MCDFKQIRDCTVISDDFAEKYVIDNPSRALINIYIQGSKHYGGFSTKINESMKLEEYMSKIVGGRTTLIDLNRVYTHNIGNLFIESLDLYQRLLYPITKRQFKMTQPL